jgi:hypothetical protein
MAETVAPSAGEGDIRPSPRLDGTQADIEGSRRRERPSHRSSRKARPDPFRPSVRVTSLGRLSGNLSRYRPRSDAPISV